MRLTPVRCLWGLWGCLALVVTSACSPEPQQQAPQQQADESATAQFYALAGDFHAQLMQRSPILAAQSGYDTAGDAWGSRSADSLAAERLFLEHTRQRLLNEIDYHHLDNYGRIQYRILEEELDLRLQREHLWRDHVYPLNQIVGLHLLIPNTLINHHSINSRQDAEAYIRRLEDVEQLFDELIAEMHHRETVGMLMPKPVYPRLITGAQQIISGTPFEEGGDSPVWADFTRKLKDSDLPDEIAGELLFRARTALLGSFGKAYGKLIERLETEQEITSVDGGVWQLPDGERFYEFAVRLFTTTDLTPAQVHRIGLDNVERIHQEMRDLMVQARFEGSLPDFFEFMRTAEQFYYPDTDAGREAYLQLARKIVADIEARIEDIVFTRPVTPVTVRRFEAYREHSAPGGMYNPGSPDGSQPGIIYLNLARMSSAPVYGLDSLLYHEGIPGHHLQKSLIAENPLVPEIRKIYVWWLYGAFIEGWALYAEFLAKQMGFYQDPYADFGRLAAELWRAVRLVVDTGLHAMRWSRQEAIDYMVENTPGAVEGITREVDRYLIVPGQATGFMIGMLKILELREQTAGALGEAFDIREFHRRVLEHGNVPLWVLDESVTEWIAVEGQEQTQHTLEEHQP